MPLPIDLQQSLRLLGKVRMGAKKRTAGGKEYPSKLTEWRITSPSYELLEVVAHNYGGSVQVWEGAPNEGRQFEVFTETDRLPVAIPASDNALIHDYEMWSAGGCVRRCNGAVEQLSGGACMCPADRDERAALAQKGGACKITTRLKVMLYDVPDIGVWMLESHGYYAAVELAGAEDILQMARAAGVMIPAQLRIDQRTVKRNGETRRFAVPVLELVTVTARQLLAGEAPVLGGPSRVLGAAAPAAIDAPSRAALPAAARVPARTDAPEANAPAVEGGPPMPPLPHEEGPPPARSVNRVAIAAREANLDDNGRHDLCRWASEGRVESSKELTDDEATAAIDAAKKLTAKTHRFEADAESLSGFRLVNGNFGWAQPPDTTAPVDAAPPAGELSVEQVTAMKGAELVAELKARGLQLGGTVPEIRGRLLEALGLGTEVM